MLELKVTWRIIQLPSHADSQTNQFKRILKPKINHNLIQLPNHSPEVKQIKLKTMDEQQAPNDLMIIPLSN